MIVRDYQSIRSYSVGNVMKNNQYFDMVLKTVVLLVILMYSGRNILLDGNKSGILFLILILGPFIWWRACIQVEVCNFTFVLNGVLAGDFIPIPFLKFIFFLIPMSKITCDLNWFFNIHQKVIFFNRKVAFFYLIFGTLS